jgi:hypothetical protein
LQHRTNTHQKKWTADVILNGVPKKSKVTGKEIKKVGYLSFISPFVQTMQNPNFLPLTDLRGFDRVAFHKERPFEILNFLEENLNAN